RRSQVEEELAEPAGQQEALVDDRLRGQARDVEVAFGIDAALADAILGELADHVQRALPRARRHAAKSHVDLAEHRHHRTCDRSEVRGTAGTAAPAEPALALLARHRLEHGFARRALRGIRRQEYLADREPPALRNRDLEPLGLAAEEAIR